MSVWSPFPFVRITLVFTGGILTAYHFKSYFFIAGVLLLLLFITYLVLVKTIPKPTFHQWSPWLGCIGLGCIFLAGYSCLVLHTATNFTDHLVHWAATIEAYEAITLEDTHEKGKSICTTVAVRKARINGKWQKLEGKVKLYLPSSAMLNISYGAILLIRGSPQPISPPRNPNEFDYQCFLGYANIYHQHVVQGKHVCILAHRPPNPLKAFSLKLRNHFEHTLAQSINNKEARGIALALLLGIKDELDFTMKEAYTNAGVMHILAVSGLHVGMLYWFLRVLLERFPSIRRLRWFVLIASLSVLWLYALITGLSPSAMRATTMLTFIIVAQTLDRQHNMYNSLSASAFVLLLFDPLLIFAVGFQLSYLAVLGIVYLQPKINRWWAFDHWLLDKLWALSSVSLAAQLATTPISLYYFHQFPTYFLITNWVVVPAAFFIVGTGLLVLLTSFWKGLSACAGWLLEKIILLVNQFIYEINKLPFSLIDHIFLETTTLLLLYGLLVALLLFLQVRKFHYVVIASTLALIFFVQSMKRTVQQQSQKKVIFYSINRHQAIAFVDGRYSILWTDKRLQEDKYTYHIAPHQLAIGITSTAHYSRGERAKKQLLPLKTWKGGKVIVWQQKIFIFIDKPSVALPNVTRKIKTDFLVIEENSVHTLQPLLERFDVGRLIIGTSNKKQLALQLKIQAEALNLPSHLLQQGALTIDL